MLRDCAILSQHMPPEGLLRVTCYAFLATAAMGVAILLLGIRDLWRLAAVRRRESSSSSLETSRKLLRAMQWSAYATSASGALLLGGLVAFCMSIRYEHTWGKYALVIVAGISLASLLMGAIWGSHAKKLKAKKGNGSSPIHSKIDPESGDTHS
ncbi:MAG: hypothetical protein WBD05_09715 [Phycisphaerae bacterium]